MKKIFNLLKLGLKNPRYYIEAINVPWKYIHLVAFAAILLMSASTFVKVIPTFSRIADDFSGAVEYIPEYSISEGILDIKDGNKPLYYQSDSLQIVIDDTINTNTNFYSGIENNQKELLAPTSPFAVFIIEDYAFITIGQTVQELPGYDYIFANTHRFELFLNYIATESLSINAMLFLIIVISNAIIYWFELILISVMAGFFNVRLTRAINFRSRLKLAVVISFVPILLLEVISILLPGFIVTQYSLLAITLFIFYLAFKSHTTFIHTIMNNLDQLDEDDQEDKDSDDESDSHSK